MLSRRSFGQLYPILDVGPGGLSPRTLDLLDLLVDLDIPWLQLRCKSHASGTLVEIARNVVARAGRRGTKVVINDRVDVARIACAAGVHLGRTDLPLSSAVGAARGSLIVGASTHSVAEARAAAAAGADYLGFGPMFATQSKPDALPPRSLATLREVRRAVDLPIVAIGGITEETAAEILAAGADAVAMIGALAISADPARLVRRIRGL